MKVAVSFIKSLYDEKNTIKLIDMTSADYIHVDIMDGEFVPTKNYDFDDIKLMLDGVSKLLDVHLMVEHPNNTIGLFISKLRKGDTIYIHPEAEYHPSTTLQKIIDAGMIPGIAINPGTSVETIYEMLRIVKRVLVMTVNPGNAGQMFMPYVDKKIETLLGLREEMGFELYWDGACSYDKLEKYGPRGMDGFVLGTTVLFGQKELYKETLKRIREI